MEVLDFGANAEFDVCQVRFDPRNECGGRAEYSVLQNLFTDRRVCRICLPLAVDFISKRRDSVYVRRL